MVVVRTFTLVIFAACSIFASGVYAYKDNFREKAYFGTKIFGEEVGGKTEKEIKEIIIKKTSEVRFNFLIDGQEIIVRPEEAGILFKTENSARVAIIEGKNEGWYKSFLKAGASLILKTGQVVSAESFDDYLSGNIPIDYEIDDEILTNFTQNLSERFNVESQNAGLVMNGTEVQVIPAIFGKKIITESVKKQIDEAIKNSKATTVKISVEEIHPDIVESDTKETIDSAKKLISIPIKYHYKDKYFLPEQKNVASWVVFNEQDVDGKKKLIPVFDSEKMAQFIFGISQSINIPAVNTKVTIKNGAERIVEREGVDGLAVDYKKAAGLTIDKLNAGVPVDLELPTYVVKSKTQVNNIFVADWSKYIEINISTQTMCAYLAGGEKVNCWAVTTGQNNVINGVSTKTPVGTFLITRKSGAGGAPGSSGGGVCMPNPPSTTPLCGINYVSTFTPQGHAIHEAWWRSSFGGQDYKWNGSHGCINATYSIAQFIYYWAPIGTPVITHY